MIFMKKLLLKSIVLAASAFLISSAGTMSVSADEITEEELAAAKANENFMFGDLDEDGTADLTDMTILSQHLLRDIHLSPALVPAADVMYDNEINTSDLALFKQFVMDRNNIVLGYEEMTDVTDMCREYRTSSSNFIPLKEPVMICSMDEYNVLKSRLDFAGSDDDKLAEDITEEFFRNNRLAVWTDNCNIANGVKVNITSVKEKTNGDVVLSYDRVIPTIMTSVGCVEVILTAVPGAGSADSSVSVVFNDIRVASSVSSLSPYLKTDFIIEGDPEYDGDEENVIITSLEQYNEYVSAGHRTMLRDIEKEIEINEKFFEKYDLAVFCDFTNIVNGVKYKFEDYTYDSLGNVKLRFRRYFPSPEETGNERRPMYYVKPVDFMKKTSDGKLSLEFIDFRRFSGSECREYRFTPNDPENPDRPTETIWKTVITSFEEYEEYMKDERRANIRELEKTENISEEFFENNCIAIINAYDNNQPYLKHNLLSVQAEVNKGVIILEYDLEYDYSAGSIKNNHTFDYFVTVIPYNTHIQNDNVFAIFAEDEDAVEEYACD